VKKKPAPRAPLSDQEVVDQIEALSRALLEARRAFVKLRGTFRPRRRRS